MLELKKLERFSDELTSLKETSYDGVHDAYLTNLDVLVYNFDKIKEKYLKKIKDCQSLSTIVSFRSNDALYNKNEKLIFIEFKNGCITSIKEKAEIRVKISESLLILTDILDAKLKELRNVCCYILVYNKNKNVAFEKQRNNTSINQISTTLSHLAGTNFLIEGFDRYRVFFHKVYTINEDELEDVLASL